MTDGWLNVDTEARSANPAALATVLESVAETLREGPQENRYHMDLMVEQKK